VEEKKKIFIHGDYDADGICATALLWEYLYRELEADVTPYIPSRIDEGYGLSKESLEAMIEEGAQLIITVDCGIRDRKLIEKYIKEKKAEIIVTDHHEPPKDIIKAKYNIVHQLYPEKEFPERNISGSAIAFFLTQAIKEENGEDTKITIDTPGLDLVALSTVTDLMPLIGINRVFVKYGLEVMQKGNRLGIKTLCNVAQVKLDQLESYHLGFVIGPRINAAGRIGEPMDALRLLLTNNSKKALSYAMKLDRTNLERQSITETLLNSAREVVSIDDNLIFVHGENWHEGIIGLVAGKLLEEFGKPVVVSTTSNGETKGSARSISKFNITEAIEKYADKLEKYGGHAQAAGFTVAEGKLEEFKKELIAHANEILTKEDLTQTLEIDLEMSPVKLNLENAQILEALKPYGFGNPRPNVAITNVEVTEKKTMGSDNQHLKLTVSKDNQFCEIVMFYSKEDIEEILEGSTYDFAGSVGVNEWNGNKSAQFIANEWRNSV
jgi:single-stranded-DNA-specific exonuclease